jgi:hypothetical protein
MFPGILLGKLLFAGPRNSAAEYLLGKEEVIGSSPIVGSINHESQVVVEQQGNRLARSFICLRRQSNGEREI